MPFIPELASFIPDLAIQAGFRGSSGKQRVKMAAVPILTPSRAGRHSTGTKRSQQKTFYSTRWCQGLAYGCCSMTWTRMWSGPGMEVAWHHAGVPMRLQTYQSQPCQRRDPRITPFVCQATAHAEPEHPGASPWSVRLGVGCDVAIPGASHPAQAASSLAAPSALSRVGQHRRSLSL